MIDDAPDGIRCGFTERVLCRAEYRRLRPDQLAEAEAQGWRPVAVSRYGDGEFTVLVRRELPPRDDAPAGDEGGGGAE